MPIYEYSCRECGGFEVTQKITDKPLTRCPACKGKVKKLISSTSFVESSFMFVSPGQGE